MKFLLRKYRSALCILLMPYIFIFIVGTVRTNKEVTLTGDISPVGNLIEINNDYEEKGTFNSIFVMNYSHSTILQNFFVNNSAINDIEDIFEGYNHLSSSELNKMGKIQHDYAVECSIIVSYKKAMLSNSSLKLNYSLTGAIIRYYSKEVSGLQIGDIIFKINEIDVNNDQEAFKKSFNERQAGDVLTVLRGGKSQAFTITKENEKQFLFYSKYIIDYQEATPSIKVNSSFTQGPSGGLLQTLNNYNKLIKEDISLGKTIAGTGTINYDGSVGIIGGIKQKIHTAYNNKVDIFFCPAGNYDEALEAYNTLKKKERMTLVRVETFDEALGYLESCM